MKVFIAGASGVLGRRLTAQLFARGHSVIGQVRSANAENAVRAAGGEPRHADLFDAESLARAADGCDTVIHAATAIPSKTKTVPADWAMNDHIRRKGTRCLTEPAAKIGAKTYLQQSVVWVARPTDQSVRDPSCKRSIVKIKPHSMKILRPRRIRSCNRPSMGKRLHAKLDRRKDLSRPCCAADRFTIAILRARGCFGMPC